MKTHELAIANYQSPGHVVRFLHEHGVKRGDILKVTTAADTEKLTSLIIAVVVIALGMVFQKIRKERQEDGEKMLDNLFKDHTIDEIEKQVEEEYGIKIEVETGPNDEKDFLYKLSAQGLLRAYSIDEPEYTEADVKEPNPNYKGWKKDK